MEKAKRLIEKHHVCTMNAIEKVTLSANTSLEDRQLINLLTTEREDILKKALHCFSDMGGKQLICLYHSVSNYTSVDESVSFVKKLFNESLINYLVFIAELLATLNGKEVLEVYSSNMFCLEYILESINVALGMLVLRTDANFIVKRKCYNHLLTIGYVTEEIETSCFKPLKVLVVWRTKPLKSVHEFNFDCGIGMVYNLNPEMWSVLIKEYESM